MLLALSPNFAPGLGPFEVTLAIIASAVLLAPFAHPIGLRGLTPTLTGAALATGLVAVLLGL